MPCVCIQFCLNANNIDFSVCFSPLLLQLYNIPTHLHALTTPTFQFSSVWRTLYSFFFMIQYYSLRIASLRIASRTCKLQLCPIPFRWWNGTRVANIGHTQHFSTPAPVHRTSMLVFVCVCALCTDHIFRHKFNLPNNIVIASHRLIFHLREYVRRGCRFASHTTNKMRKSVVFHRFT